MMCRSVFCKDTISFDRRAISKILTLAFTYFVPAHRAQSTLSVSIQMSV